MTPRAMFAPAIGDGRKQIRLVAAAATAPAAAAVVVALLGLVHFECAAFELLAVELLDGLLGLAVRTHLHEAETTRPSGLAIGDDRNRLAGPRLRKQVLEVLVIDVEAEIADVQFSAHCMNSFYR